jgi:hypothetical protein
MVTHQAEKNKIVAAPELSGNVLGCLWMGNSSMAPILDRYKVCTFMLIYLTLQIYVDFNSYSD